jgi:hypothetical protein
MHDWRRNRGVEFDLALIGKIDDGFGPRPDGEDPFDTVVGLCSMLDVVFGSRTEGAPKTEDIRKIEGWILGQQA